MKLFCLFYFKIPVTLEKEQLTGAMSCIIYSVIIPRLIFQGIRKIQHKGRITGLIRDAECIEDLKSTVYDNTLKRAKFRSHQHESSNSGHWIWK